MVDDATKRFGIPGNHALSAVARKRRAEHLKFVKSVRESEGELPQHMKTARLALSIPELDYYVLLHRFPDLDSPDAKIRKDAWIKFYRDPASEPYRVSRRKE